MPDIVTRCDYCDVSIDYNKRWEMELYRADQDKHDRYTLCRECIWKQTIPDLANTIHDKTWY